MRFDSLQILEILGRKEWGEEGVHGEEVLTTKRGLGSFVFCSVPFHSDPILSVMGQVFGGW